MSLDTKSFCYMKMKFFSLFLPGVGGHRGDGDIFREDNLTEFRKFVVENSDGKGVHFVMADGVRILFGTALYSLFCKSLKYLHEDI